MPDPPVGGEAGEDEQPPAPLGGGVLRGAVGGARVVVTDLDHEPVGQVAQAQLPGPAGVGDGVVDQLGHDQGGAVDPFEQLALIDLTAETTGSFLQRVCELAACVVPGAEDASVSLVTGGRSSTPASTGPLARALDELQYATGYGPCLAAAEGREVQRIDDAATEARWPEYLPAARSAGLASSLSVPVPVGGGRHAALNLYSRAPRAFTPEDAATASRFASYAGVAFGSVAAIEGTRQLAEQLHTAMESRAVIEQAKGVLMANRSCSSAEAFAVLVELSQKSNTKLRAVAQAVVDRIAVPAREAG